jgi:hypothetical protein
MLKVFFDMGKNQYMTQKEARTYDQRPFRTMLVRKYIEYHVNRGFKITKEGRKALMEFLATDIARTDPMRPLTAYFDPDAYKLKVLKKSA